MNKYRQELDGIRAFAVISVIINHFDKNILPSGHLGVDIFFVLSGFVITGSLINRKLGKFWNFIIQFYVRRIKRLLPVLILVSLITGLSTVLLVYIPGYSIKTILFSLIGFSNQYLFYCSADYFSLDADLNTFTHSWSLGVEEQFYLFYPVIFWLALYFMKSKEKILLYIMGSLSILSLLLFVYLNKHNQSSAYFIMPSRFWELGFGCIVFLMNDKFKKFNIVEKFPSFLTFILLLGCLFIPNDFHKTINTLAVIVLSSLLLWQIKYNDITYKILTQKQISYIGLISYSLYLWHWPILSLSRWTVGIYWHTAIWQIPLMILLSIMSYEYVESRLRKANWSARNRNIVLIGGISSLLTMAFLIGLYHFNDKLLIRKFPWKNLNPMHNNLECHLPKYNDPITKCLCPEKTNRNFIYIIGDSHAGNLVPSVKKAIGDKMLVRYLTDETLVNSIFGYNICEGADCIDNEYQNRLAFFKKYLKKGDVVIFSMARDRIYDRSVKFPEDRQKTLIEVRLRLLQNKLRDLGMLTTDKESLLLLIDDIPKLCDDYFAELVRNSMNPCPVEKRKSLLDRQPLTNIYLSLTNKHVKYVDPHSFLCPDSTCYAIFENKLLYTDGSPHFSNYSSSVLTLFFKSKFREFNL